MRLCRKHLVQSQPQSISPSGAMPSPVGSGLLCRDSTVMAGTVEGWSTHGWAGMRSSARVSEWTEMRRSCLGKRVQQREQQKQRPGGRAEGEASGHSGDG